MSAYEDLGVCPEIIRAIEENGWFLPTPVQAEAIPLILGGGDICVAAETGSGKTGAFGLPCLQIVHETLRNVASTMTKNPTAQSSQAREVTIDASDKDPFAVLLADKVTCMSSEDRKWCGARANIDVVSGCYMFEAVVEGSGLARVGWSAPWAALDLGTDPHGFGYGGTGKKSWNKQFESFGEPYGQGDIIGCLIDRDGEAVYFSKNGDMLGAAFDIPPALNGKPIKPHICGKKFQIRCNFNEMQFPMDGFAPIGAINDSDTSKGAFMGVTMAGRNTRHPLCVILEPTRDLATQTYRCMQDFSLHLEAPKPRIGLFVGGIDERGQQVALQQGVDICVGTMQRIMDFVRKGKLDVSNLKFFVLDEADDLMRNDDRKDIPNLKRQASRGRAASVQTLFFSATLHSDEVRRGIDTITVNPTWVDIKGKPSIPDTVHFAVYKIDCSYAKPKFAPVKPEITPFTDGVHQFDKQRDARVSPAERSMLGHSSRAKYLKPMVAVKLADILHMDSCLVFCRTNVDCDNFEKYLTELGGGRKFTGAAEAGKENPYSCVVLAGMRQQQERQNNLQHFNNREVRFLVCTDVAARGIDIQDLPYLIMLTLPDDPNQFFHRVGRVGRADKLGLAISIASTQKEKVWYHKCANRGKGCTNVELVENGGCTIWYDEPTYLKDIETVIGSKIPVMDVANFSIPGILDTTGAENLEDVGVADGRRAKKQAEPSVPRAAAVSVVAGVKMYGKSKDNDSTRATARQIQELIPAVRELQRLEKNIQKMSVTLAATNKPQDVPSF
eukprot:Lankesteria_metandrocarpae@DN3428_c2_g1_i3.p1